MKRTIIHMKAISIVDFHLSLPTAPQPLAVTAAKQKLVILNQN